MTSHASRYFVLLLLGLAMIVGCAPSDIAAIAKRQETKSKKKGKANRLAKESSPYLLLHAHNPVDWYAWGPDAFAKAKKENKPIFLSIGYSSCFWCHVMERKVFENKEIAKYMNEHFVNIKVDREERPDIDDIYMTSLTIYFQLTRSRQGGGWPLSMFLTPDGKPFAGGTYFPPKDSPGRVGFATVMKRVHQLWAKNEKDIRGDADRLTEYVRRTMKPRPVLKPVKIEGKLVEESISALVETHDPVHGGVGFNAGNPNRPKFPVPAKLALLQHAGQQGDKKSAKLLHHTLDAIAAGGIHDHLGGGFHRYSTDRRWHVPHFEKMLYDQSQLAEVYARAYEQTGQLTYKEAAEGIFRFVKRKMTDANGGFYSALDAETEGVEGEYYVWTHKEVEKTLGAKDAKLFQRVYGMEQSKVFEHGYVLHLPTALAELAKAEKTPLPDLKSRLSVMRSKLLSVRQKRKPLLRDDKILTSWNGLMIRAYATAGRIFKNAEFVKSSEKAALFILANMRDDKKRLLRSYRKGKAKLNAYVDDYAFLVSGLLALHEATKDAKWLNAARRLTDDQIRDYWSKVGGGFFFTPHHHEVLIARTRNAYDAVLPSGNAVSVRNLVQLAKRTGVAKYRKLGKDIIEAFATNLENTPTGTSHLALAVAEYLADAPKPKKKSTGKQTSAIIPISATQTKSIGRKHNVQVKAYLSVDKLPVGGKCRFVVFVEIQPKWHINANPAKPKGVIPTVFSIKSKAGVKLGDLKYPKGKPFTIEGFDETLSVYEGNIAIYGTLEIPKSVPANVKQDEMELRVRYQACTSSRCLPPKTVKLKGNLPLARPGEIVKQINSRLFTKPKKKAKKK